MKKLLIIILSLMIFSCDLVEVCTVCTEVDTGIESDFCGSPDEVQEFEDDLENTNAGGTNWECSQY